MEIRKVIAEHQGSDEWIVLDAAQAGVYPSAVDVVRMISRKDRSAARRGISTTTIVEWRNVPAGFVPPEPV